MKIKFLLLALFVAGLSASIAIAGPPPGHGHSHGHGHGHGKGEHGDTDATSTSADKHGDEKVTMCHKTGSPSHPFARISVSKHAVQTHLAHGDTPLAEGGTCGGLVGGGADTSSTTTPGR